MAPTVFDSTFDLSLVFARRPEASAAPGLRSEIELLRRNVNDVSVQLESEMMSRKRAEADLSKALLLMRQAAARDKDNVQKVFFAPWTSLDHGTQTRRGRV